MTVPVLDGEARRENLRRAVEARRLRAEVKRAVKLGDLGLADVLERAASSEPIANLRVVELLQAMPGHGPSRAARLMEMLSIAPSRRVRGLGPRQRAALLAAVGE